MAGRAPLTPPAPATVRRSVLRLAAALWPLAAGAAGVNLFFASLIGGWVGLPILPPWVAALGGLVLGWPAAVLFARHLARLMAQADGAAAD